MGEGAPGGDEGGEAAEGAAGTAAEAPPQSAMWRMIYQPWVANSSASRKISTLLPVVLDGFDGAEASNVLEAQNEKSLKAVTADMIADRRRQAHQTRRRPVVASGGGASGTPGLGGASPRDPNLTPGVAG
eukprot:178778_1